MNSAKLNTELRTLEKRRAEIATDATAAETAYSKAQDNLLAGSAQTSDVSDAHSSLLILQSALSTMDDKIEAKKAEVRAAQEAETRQSATERIKQIHTERERAMNDYFSARDQAEEALSSAVDKLLDARQRWASLGSEAAQMGLSLPERWAVRGGGLFVEAVGFAEQTKVNRLERERNKEASRAATQHRQEREWQQRQSVMPDAA
jgi:uncharacterized membrane protein